MCPAQDTSECMNTSHIQYTWECMTPAEPQPEPSSAHTPGHSSISTHKQDCQQKPAKLAPQSPDCWQVLNLLLAQNTCPGKLPFWHPDVILTLTSEITGRLLCGLQEERPQGEQLLQHPLGPAPGRIPASPPQPAAHSSTAALLCRCSCRTFHKWSHILQWSWAWLIKHIVPSQMTWN